MAAPSPSSMFEPEVIAELRRQFDAADKDGNGELDAAEACELFSRACDPNASAAEVKKLADNLRNQLDSDRSGTISFNEYCFRFGRRYQQELRRRRTDAAAAPVADASSEGLRSRSASATGESEAAAELRRERESLEREREALKREREEMRRGASDGASQSEPSSPQAHGTSRSFAPGARVALQGLRGAPELNGRIATVLRYDDASARYVVQLDVDGIQKSLKPENLSPSGTSAGSTASSSTPPGPSGPSAWSAFTRKAQDCFTQAAAHVQVWLAAYEWWQIALGAAVILLFATAYFQVGGRYSGGGAPVGRHNSGYASSRPAGAGGDLPRRDTSRDDYDDAPPFRDEDVRYQEESHHRNNQHNRNHGQRRSHYDDDYGGGGGYDSGYSSGGGGGGNNNQLWTMMIVAGLGYACYKGIIPVHKMSWFQLYMVWNMISPLIMGGRGGGMGMGGMGGMGRGRRRGFF